MGVGAGTFHPPQRLRSIARPLAAASQPRAATMALRENPKGAALLQFRWLIKPSHPICRRSTSGSLEPSGVDGPWHEHPLVEETGKPTLGAWALVDVWMDGMEVRQFTISSGSARHAAILFMAELDYGLERI